MIPMIDPTVELSKVSDSLAPKPWILTASTTPPDF